MRAGLAPLLLIFLSCGRVPPKPVQEPSPLTSEFWKTWSDGQAEVNAYDLTQPRYGKPRPGTAVAIFVTETFANSARVKSDPGKRPASDEFPVMKLNLIKDYQTGIYDYSDMLSTFVALQPVNNLRAGQPTKISFSSREWCGHVFSQILFTGPAARIVSHSYFDGEADSSRDLSLENSDYVSEDALFHWARGMSWPYLQPDDSRQVKSVSSLATSRVAHVPATVGTIQLETSSNVQSIKTRAGDFETVSRKAVLPNGTVLTMHVEKAVPYRLIRWESSTGERADLLGSDRMKYWQMNAPGGEEALKRLGLKALRRADAAAASPE